MPKSKVRKKDEYVPAARASLPGPTGKVLAPSPVWYPAAICTVLILGLAYIVVYYMAGERVPVMQDLGGWNFAIAFALMITGLGLAVRWR
ncbi:MAG: cell division protein CrgA [Jatrophihabitantaceae bacterium]|nr:cell division protein CrgA [Jatrophihabitantaceae bacterium]